MIYRKDLINLFGSADIDEGVKIRLKEAHGNIFGFKRHYKLCKQFRKDIEAIVFENDLYSFESLSFMLKYYQKSLEMQPESHRGGRVHPNMLLLKDLTLELFDGQWSQKQKKYYTDKIAYFDKQYDYFLSFTNRVLGNKAGPNPINRKYNHLINHILGEAYTKKADNILAECLDYYLTTEKGFKGFFYPDREGDNTIVERKLKEGCDDTRNFIQIVQNVMFEDPKDRKNYCLVEFEYAKDELDDDALLFVLAEKRKEDLYSPDQVKEKYREWLGYVGEKDALHIEFSEFNNENLEKVFDKINDKILNRINTNAESICDNIPLE